MVYFSPRSPKNSSPKISPPTKLVLRASKPSPRWSVRVRGICDLWVTLLKLDFINRFTTKNVVKCGILVTILLGVFCYILFACLRYEIRLISMYVEDLQAEVIALATEIRRQRTLLRVYSDSTSEHALMAHIINLMRANRVGIEDSESVR